MNIVLEPDIEQWVGQEAQRFGIAPEAFVAQRLRDQRNLVRQLATLPDEEGDLLARINHGLPTDFWTRYHELVAKRQAQTLTDEEQAELILLSDRVEQKNAERAPYLIALARLRGVSLPELVRQLGLHPVSVTA
ncbi:MAG: hypothetical protein H8F28_07255 [Fibrella sp.]|nr:hypothetical protein [Armatimonadota bacterium]